ncbi:MAG: hypothetical protein ACKV0T_28140 [Planctomycetales bacterium]
MHPRRVQPLTVVCVFLTACQRAPSPPPGDLSAAVSQSIDEAMGQLGEKIAEVDRELKRKSVSIVIDGVRDSEHEQELSSQVQKLRDADARSNNFQYSGAYFLGDKYFRVSPVTDLEAAAKAVDFGRVIGLDPAARTLIIDASQPAEAPPEGGYPGIESIEKFVIAKTTKFAETLVAQDALAKYGRDRVVLVWMPTVKTESGADTTPEEIRNKLRALPAEIQETPFPGFGPQQAGYVVVTVAPVTAVDDVQQALQGEPIIAVNATARVILLGDLQKLLPAPVSVD